MKWPSYIGIFVISLGVLALALSQAIPDVRQMNGCMITKMHSYKLCPGGDAYVPLSEVSKFAIDAIIVSEDGAFFNHNGFDWFEIRQTIEKDLSKLNFARGGSTITQQLAKNVFLSGEKTLLRKAREAIVTVLIEKNFSKSQILERYLNVVEFGPKVFGIKAASEYYFNKLPSDLDILESAYLAFLLPNPKVYHQSFALKNLTEFARRQMAQIVSRMQKFHKISAEVRDENLARLGSIDWLNAPAIEEEPMPSPALGDEDWENND